MVIPPPPGSYPSQPSQDGYGAQQSPPGYGQWQAPLYPPRTTNGLAIAALVLGILGFFGISLVLSIIFGCVALKQISRRGQRGKAMAIIGIVLSVLWAGLLVLIVIVGVNLLPKRDASGQITKSGPMSVFDLRVNDCFDGVANGHTTKEVTAKPCAEPHDAQMIDKIEIPDGAYPGASSLAATGTRLCEQNQESRLERSPLHGRLAYFMLAPNQRTWDDGNHTVSCAVVDKQGGKLPGPVDGG